MIWRRKPALGCISGHAPVARSWPCNDSLLSCVSTDTW